MIDVNFDEICVDQAVRRSTCLDREFVSAYTPWGIRQMDTNYCNLIGNMPSKEYADKLEKEIINNPHLHDIIKENLLSNLEMCRKDIGSESLKRWQDIEDKKPYPGRTVEILVGHNKGIVGTVIWFDEGNLGKGRVGVTSNNKNFWSLSSSDNEAYYDRNEVEVVGVV